MSEPKNVSASGNVVPKKMFIFGAVLAVLLFGAWLVQTEAFKLATTHQPERFTELYFVEPEKLPGNIIAGKPYLASFAIANHEAAPQVYTYQVTVSAAGKLEAQDPVKVTLSDGQRLTPVFSYSTPQPGDDVRVIVTLLGRQQSIQFKVES